VTHGADGLFASHLPLMHDRARGVLAGHLARANPHRALAGDGEALVIFQGAEAYVSPNWYPSKAIDGRAVPTWNYEAIHVYGALSWREDEAWLRANVAALANRFEADQPAPWALDHAPADYTARLLAQIVGLELRITRIEAKRKLSQNRSEADRQGVIDGLSASARETDRAMAALMKREQAAG
jgi:transcriptional regulator